MSKIMTLRIATILVIFLSSAISAFAEITIPMTPEGPDDIEITQGNGHRSRPIADWFNIDVETHAISTSLRDIINYEILDAEDAVISTASTNELCDALASLPEGLYTLRITTSGRTYIGLFTTQPQ